MNSRPVEHRALRQALGRFATGVTIITCRDGAGAAVGLTVNSFASLSLDPPLVLWSLRSASPSMTAFRTTQHFAVNVLSEEQVELSRRFALQLPDKFAEGQWSDGLGGAPVLSGCSAVLECERVDARETGDHWLFIGQVHGLFEAPIAPLVFQSGRYHLLGEIL
jgi:3-hydroxy-9,10-secoandrosta-1,3,5(10)-triene-9,17-dione monooxygenase reductase component